MVKLFLALILAGLMSLAVSSGALAGVRGGDDLDKMILQISENQGPGNAHDVDVDDELEDEDEDEVEDLFDD